MEEDQATQEALSGDDNGTKILSSKFSRAIKTTGIAAKSGVRHLNYLKNRTLTSENDTQKRATLKKDHEAEIGRILFSGLSQMRGTALKASQLLSLEADLLPEGIRQELAKSCYQVPPINRALIRKVFVQEFGKDASKIFCSFDPTAHAAASLGQVHKATLECTQSHTMQNIAVKVQYPGIRESIDSDLKIMRFVLSGLSKTTSHIPNKHVIDTTLSEIENCLKEEVDYEQEAENTRWFARHLKLEGVRIPKVFEEITRQRVLCTEFLSGHHVDTWLETNPTQKERNRYGQKIFDLFLHCAFQLRKLHADPHMGNYLFLEDGNLGLIDFGCVKTLSTEFTQNMSRLVCAILDNDQPQVLESYKALQIMAPNYRFESYMEEIHPILSPLQQWMSSPYNRALASNEDGSPMNQTEPTEVKSEAHYFNFAHLPAPPTEMSQSNHKRAMQSLRSLTREQPYFDRSYFGVYQLLKKMKAVVNTHNPWMTQTKV